jgi:hypothetical protein
MPFVGNRRFDLKVVGESHYEQNLYDLCGPATDHIRQFPKTAILTLEVDNPYDRNAVRVDIDGLTVGHLSRSDAAWFRRICGGSDGSRFVCDAVVVSLRGSAACDYGVRLDIDDGSLRKL